MAIQQKSQNERILDEGDSGFMSCGLDRSCPKSVTTPQAQGIRLDQYQSTISGNQNKRQRRQSYTVTTAASATQHFVVAPTASTRLKSSAVPDHDFEWYDLDAIREADGSSSRDKRAIVVGHHDFNAGLVFTTERQILVKGVEINVVNPCRSKIKQKKDLFFWVNGGHDKKRVEETPFEKEEREFRERMQELEVEINDNASSSFCSSLSSILDGVQKETDFDSDSDVGFVVARQLGDPMIRS
mmetsp:Transcript_15572/g.43122  ORF Transcript_15572/g.43122 Transcript_15572/m.43122 type:complete len:242 (-) Transcript_15572:3229-3954(-)